MGRVGIAQVDEEWVSVECMEDDKYVSWRAKKGHGRGHDRRMMGDERDARNKRIIREEDAMTRWSSKAVAGTPLHGPAVGMAPFEALRTVGLTVVGHHSECVFGFPSGVPKFPAISWAAA